MAKDPGIQVLIPYKELEALLGASAELKKVRIDVKRLQDQQQALWSHFATLMENYRELEKHLND